MNENIKKSRTKYDIIFSAVILIIGVVTCLISTSDVITIMGVTFILVSIICWLILKSGYRDAASSKRLSKTELYYAVEFKTKVIKSIMENPLDLMSLPKSPMNTLKVDVFYNESDAYVQLFEYVPCNYQPCTKLLKYDADKVRPILH